MGEQVANWRKSTASATGEQCVEVGTASAAIAVRDTTDRDGITLTMSTAAWTRFLSTLH